MAGRYDPYFAARQAGLGDAPQQTSPGFQTMADAQAFMDRAREAGYSDEEIQAFAQNTGGYVPSAGLMEDFTRGAQRGAYAAGSALATLANEVGNAMGVEGVGDETGARWEEQIQNPDIAPRVGSFRDIGDVEGTFSDALSYAAGLAGMSAPEMAAVLAGGVAGGVAGGPVGALAAGTAVATPFFTGRNLQEQIDNGQEPDLAKAAAYGVAQGALDAVLGKILVGRFGTPSGVADRMTPVVRDSITKASAKYAGRVGGDAIVEAATEVAQEALGAFQGNPEFAQIILDPQTEDDRKKRDEYFERGIESAVGGGVLGGGIGAVSNAPQAVRDVRGVEAPVESTLPASAPAQQAGLGGSTDEDIDVATVSPRPGMAPGGASVDVEAGMAELDAEITDEVADASVEAELDAGVPAFAPASRGLTPEQEAAMDVAEVETRGLEGGVPQAISDLEQQREDARSDVAAAQERLTQAREARDVPRERQSMREYNRAVATTKELDDRIGALRDEAGLPDTDVRFTAPGMEGVAATPEGAQVVGDAQAMADAKGITAPQEEAGLGDEGTVVPFTPTEEGETQTPDQKAIDDAYTTDDRENPVITDPVPVPYTDQSAGKVGQGVKWTTPTGETYTGTVEGVSEGISGNEIYHVLDSNGVEQDVNTATTPLNPLSDRATAEMKAEMEEEAREAEAEKERKAAADAKAKAKADEEKAKAKADAEAEDQKAKGAADADADPSPEDTANDIGDILDGIDPETEKAAEPTPAPADAETMSDPVAAAPDPLGSPLIGAQIDLEMGADAAAARLEILSAQTNMTPAQAREYVVLAGQYSGVVGDEAGAVQHEHIAALVGEEGRVHALDTNGDPYSVSTRRLTGLIGNDAEGAERVDVHHNHPVKDEYNNEVPGFSNADLQVGARVIWAHANDGITSFVFERLQPLGRAGMPLSDWQNLISTAWRGMPSDIDSAVAAYRTILRSKGRSINTSDRIMINRMIETVYPAALAELGYGRYADNRILSPDMITIRDNLIAKTVRKLKQNGYSGPTSPLSALGGTTEILEARTPQTEDQGGSRDTGPGVGDRGGYGPEEGGESASRSERLGSDDLRAIAAALVAQGYPPRRGRDMEHTMRAFVRDVMGYTVDPGSAAEASLQTAIESAAVQRAQAVIRADAAAGVDPQATYDKLVDLYDEQPRIRTEAGDKRILQQFSTPIPMAYLAQIMAGATSPDVSILEPTAGTGAMLTAVTNPANVTAIELDTERQQALVDNIGSSADHRRGDALTEIEGSGPFDVVLANPPFGKQIIDNTDTRFIMAAGAATNQIDLAIVDRSLAQLRPGGKAVLIIGAPTNREAERKGAYGARGASNRQAFFTNLYRNFNVTSHTTADGSLYTKQGASWPVDIIVVEGKATTPRTGVLRPFDTDGVPPVVKSWDSLWETAFEGRPDANVGMDARGQPRNMAGSDAEGGPAGAGPSGIPQPDDRQDTGNAEGGDGPAGTGGGIPPQSDAGTRSGPRGNGRNNTRQPEPAGPGETNADDEGEPGSDTGSADVSGAGNGGRGSVVDDLMDELFGGPPDAEPPVDPATATTPDSRNEAKAPPRNTSVSPPQMSDDALSNPPDPVEPDVQNPADVANDIGDILDGLGRKQVRFSIAPKNPHQQSQDMTSDPTYISLAEKFSNLLKGLVRQGGAVAEALKAGNIQETMKQVMLWFRDTAKYTRERMMKVLPFLRQYEADVVSGRIKPLDGDAAPVNADDRNQASGETEFEVDWLPSSKTAFRAGTTVPRAMNDPMKASLATITEAVGDIDTYVADKLAYTRAEMLGSPDAPGPFSQEQVDALAAAIYNHEENEQALIIGDQTGVGKGRIVAGMMRYARLNGMTPVFVTKDLALASAMIEDLNDIGELENIKPLLTQTSGAVEVDLGDKGKYDLKAMTKKDYEKAFGKWARNSPFNPGGTITETGALPEGYNAVFTTYSQMDDMKSTISSDMPVPDRAPRTDAVLAIAKNNAFLILDESHMAAGESKGEKSGRKDDAGKGRAVVFREAVANAAGVMYSSATYAKNPSTMFLYGLRTAMKDAVGGALESLAGAITAGGIPLQQIVTNILVESGQYVRRQRTYKGVSMQTVKAEVDTDRITSLASVTNKFYKTDVPFIDVRQQFAEEMAIEHGLAAMGEDGSIGDAGMGGAAFSSVMHNIIDQALLAMKIDAVVENTIERVAKGEKVVIGLANTMGAALDTYIADNELTPGADLSGVDFRQTMRRYLEKVRSAKIKDPNDPSKSYTYRMSDEWLMSNHPELLDLWNEAAAFLNETPLDLPFSPIDAIRDRLREAGITNDEITGRSRIIEDGKLASRSASQNAKRGIMDAFNGGDTDVLIINQSGSTGISLHADGRFKDQKPRHMIIAQPTPDIVEFMQMLGRIHRTGQTALPGYSIMISDAPAEKRIAARLMNKLRSLNANTSADDKNAIKVDAVDFLNKHGSRVAMELLRDDATISDALQILPPPEDGGDPSDGSLINKLLNRSAMMPFEDQELLVQELEVRYLAEIKNLADVGLNDNEIQFKDLQASSKEDPIELTGQKTGETPFSSPSNYEIVEVNRDVKPKPISQIKEELSEVFGLPPKNAAPLRREGDRHMSNIRRGIANSARDALAGTSQEVQRLQDDMVKANAEAARAQAAVDKLIDGMTKEEIAAKQKADKDFAQKLKDAHHVKRTTATKARSAQNDYETIDRDRKKIEQFANDFETITRNVGFTGRPVSMTYKRTASEDGITQPGFVMNLVKTRENSNPFALGSYVVEVQTPDLKSPIKIPMTKLKSGQAVLTIADQQQIEEAFERANVSREKRAVVTGNILAGFAYLNNQGQIIRFTRQGSTDQFFGVMMPREFDLDKFYRAQPVQLTTSDQIQQYFAGLGPNDSAASKVLKTPGGGAMVQIDDAGQYRLDIHNMLGRRIHMDQAFLDLVKKSFPDGLVAPKTKGKSKSQTRHVRSSDFSAIAPLLDFIAQTHGSPWLVNDINHKDRARQIIEPASAPRTSAAQPAFKRGKRAPLATGVATVVARMTGGNADVETVERLVAGGEGIRRSGALSAEQQEVSGMYDPLKSLITVSMNSPFGSDVTAVHEAWHWLRDKGVVPGADLRILEKANKRLRDMAAREIGKESAALLDQEEAEAYALQRYYSNPSDPALKGLQPVMERIRAFFERMANWLEGSGFRSIEDVMGDALSGRMAELRSIHPTSDWRKEAMRSLDPLFSAAQPFTNEQFSPEVNSAFETLRSRKHVHRSNPADQTFYGRFMATWEMLREEGLRNVVESYMPSASRVRQSMVDRFEALRQLDMKAYGDTGDIARGLDSVWKRAHVVTTSTGPIMERMMKYGNLVWNPSKKDFDVDRSGGLMSITKPIGQMGLIEPFELWLAADRERNNPVTKKRREDFYAGKKGARPPLFLKEDLDLADRMFNELAPDQKKAFIEARDGLKAYNRQFINAIADSGLLRKTGRGEAGVRQSTGAQSGSEVDRLLGDNLMYIPFSRIMNPDVVGHDSEGNLSVVGGRGFSTASNGMRRLKGSNLQLNDPMETLMGNMQAMVDKARRNTVGAEAIRIGAALGDGTVEPSSRTYKGMVDRRWMEANQSQLADLGIPVDEILHGEGSMREVISGLIGDAAPKSANEASIMVDGKQVFYRVGDPMLLESLRAMEPEQRSWFEATILGGARTLLTKAVSADPTFMYRNGIRDAQQAWMLAPENFTPGVDTVRGFKKVWKGGLGSIKDGTEELLDIGSASLYDTSRLDRLIQKAAGKTPRTTILGDGVSLWQAWEEIGKRAELANRQAVYDSVMEATGGNKDEALFQAMFMTNYASKGNNKWMRYLITTVPYINARIQGLDRLAMQGTGFAADPKSRRRALAKQLMVRGAMMAAAATLAEGLLAGDDDYEQLEEWEKDAYFHFRLMPGGGLYRIPKGFEVGLIFGSLPSRIYRRGIGADGNEESAGFVQRAIKDTLSFDPTPQAVKPIIEVMRNRNSFTGRPIENIDVSRLPAEMRYNQYTSDALVEGFDLYNAPLKVMNALFGTNYAISPLQAQSLIRGYTGPMGSYALAAADGLTEAVTGDASPLGAVTAMPAEVARKMARSMWVEDVPSNTKFTTEFYNMRAKVTEAHAGYDRAKTLGDLELAQEILDENMALLRARSMISKTAGNITEMRNMIKRLQVSKQGTPETRKAQIDRLQATINQLTARAVSAVAAG